MLYSISWYYHLIPSLHHGGELDFTKYNMFQDHSLCWSWNKRDKIIICQVKVYSQGLLHQCDPSIISLCIWGFFIGWVMFRGLGLHFGQQCWSRISKIFWSINISYNMFQNHNDHAMVLSHFIKNLFVVVVRVSIMYVFKCCCWYAISPIASPK